MSYYEINKMSASTFKEFQRCEAAAVAGYRPEPTTAMLVGSYVDAYFEGSLESFKTDNPAIFTQKGTLRSEYQQAEQIIQRIERDELFMEYLSGEKQVVVTGEISGVPFKGKIDCLLPHRAIVDLKVMRDFTPIWVDGEKLPFVEAWGYDIQLAIYQRLVGGQLPVFIAAATKEKEPDIAIISIPQERLNYCIDLVEHYAPIYYAMKRGEFAPERCERCDYCKQTKTLSSVIDYRDIA